MPSLPFILKRVPLALGSTLTFALLACGLGTPTAGSSVRLAGRVHGGQQPVAGVMVQLYAVGSTGNGSPTTPLLPSASVSAADGTFGFGGFTCPTPATLVYLAGTGGSPAPGMVNPNLSLMAALGRCDSITPQTYVAVNEITSVAAVNALAPFMTATDAIGASPAAASALGDAFALAAQYANPASGTTPGVNPPAGLDPTLVALTADIAAACVNSAGGVAGDPSPCGQFFADVTPAGTTPPSDVLGGLLQLALNPSLNATQLYNLASPSSPFQPVPSSAPTSFALSASRRAFSVSATAANFGTVAWGSSAARALTVTNTGTMPLAIVPTLAGANPSDFAAATAPCATLAVGASCGFTVTADPAEIGTLAATLTLADSSGQAQHSVALAATAVYALLPGANVQIPFTEGTGSIAHDLSGNGNDCTLATGANAPAWTAAGIDHLTTQPNPRYCTFAPSTTLTDLSEINSRTRTWCGYIRPATADVQNSLQSTLFGSSNRFGLGAFWLSGQGFLSAGYAGNYHGYTRAGYSNEPTYGWRCVTETLGSAAAGEVDRFFYDDHEVNSYGLQNGTYDFRTVGEYDQLGSLPWDFGEGFFQGITSYVLEYPTVLTPAQIAANFRALQQLAFTSRGVGTYPPGNTSTAPQLVCSGDSITNQSPGNVVTYCQNLSGSLNQPFNVTNVARAGEVTSTLVAQIPLEEGLLYSPNAPFNLASQQAGNNDLNLGGATDQDVVQQRLNYAVAVKKIGFQALWVSLLSSVNRDADAQAINTQLRALAQGAGVTLVDVANDPCLGRTGAYANSPGCNYFQDGVHVNQAGADAMKLYFSNAVNYLTGATSAKPTLVTAAAYQVQAADGYVSVAPAGAGSSITLPSCLGYSVTTPFTVYNASASAGVSVVSQTGEMVNGVSGPVLVPNLAQLVFVSTPRPAVTGGCDWVSH